MEENSGVDALADEKGVTGVEGRWRTRVRRGRCVPCVHTTYHLYRCPSGVNR